MKSNEFSLCTDADLYRYIWNLRSTSPATLSLQWADTEIAKVLAELDRRDAEHETRIAK